jgi:invasion protein IalB
MSFKKIMPVAFGALFLSFAAIAEDSEVTISTKGYQDWQLRCEQLRGGSRTCVMTQQALVQESGQKLMQVNIAKQGKNTLMTIILPLGIDLATGVFMLQGDLKDELPVAYCAQSGCVVNQRIDAQLLSAWAKEPEVKISIKIVGGQAVSVPFSTKGLTAAHSGL